MIHKFDLSILKTALLITGLALFGGLTLAFGGPLVAAALVAAVFVSMIVLRDIEIGFWSVIAVITLLPFATLPIKIGVTPTFLDAALGIVIVIWLLEMVTGKRREVVTTTVTFPIILFLLVAIFAFIFGMGNGPLTGTLLRKFAELLLSIGFVVVIVDYCRDWDKVERLTRALLIGGAAASAIAIALWLLPDDLANTILNGLQRVEYPGGWVIRYIEENPAKPERAIGTSIDPNALGGLLTLLGAMAVPQLFTDQPLFRKRWSLLIAGLIFVAILLTFSRGAFLALGASVAFLAVVRYRKLIPSGIFVLLLILVLPVTQSYVVRLLEGFTGSDLATQMRFGEYRDAWSLIARYPLFGVGFAGSPDLDLYLGVANVYMSIAQQMGLLGLAAFSVVIGAAFVKGWLGRVYFLNHPRHDAIWLGYLAALVGGLAAGVFDHYLFNTEFHHTVTAFWLVVGLVAATGRLAGLKGAEKDDIRP